MAFADAAWLSHPGAPALRTVRLEDTASDGEAPGERVDLDLDVAGDSPWVQGHFPGRAVLPGVVLLRWAIEAACWQWPDLGTVRSISNLKFQNPVLPPARVTLTLELRHGDTGRRLDFRWTRADQACARGGVHFT